MSLPKFIPLRRTQTLMLGKDRIPYTEIDWNATLEFAFDCLTMQPHSKTSAFEIKMTCINWLIGNSPDFLFACKMLELDSKKIRNKAIRIVALNDVERILH